MATKRTPISFPEFEPKGKGAILRSAEEVRAEEALMNSTPPEKAESNPNDSNNTPITESQNGHQQDTPRSRQPKRKEATSSNDIVVASTDASMLARYHASTIETIRRRIKIPGKEVSYVRLTTTEKGQLSDIVHNFKRQGTRTSETEINRIAVNFVLEDYKANGDQSIIVKVFEALLA